jgi:hypothetical protein
MGPVVIPDGTEEWEVNRILDSRRQGKGLQYLVCWAGYGLECNTWLASREVEDCEALDIFENSAEGQLGSLIVHLSLLVLTADFSHWGF